MKKQYLLPLLTLPFFAHSREILLEKSYGKQHTSFLFDAQPTADYGFTLAGSSLFGTAVKTESVKVIKSVN